MSSRLKWLKTIEWFLSWFNAAYWRNLRGRLLRWNRRRIAHNKIGKDRMSQYNEIMRPKSIKERRYRFLQKQIKQEIELIKEENSKEYPQY